MKLSLRKRTLRLKLKKIKLTKEDDLEDTADSLSEQSLPKIKPEIKFGKFNQTKLYEIKPNLFMSGYHSAKDLETLQESGITHVVNLTAQHCANFHSKYISYSNFKLSDNSNFDLNPFFAEITNLIQEKIYEGHKVLVHCKMGVSRAPSLVIAFLILKTNLSFKDAFDYVFQINSKISPNLGYLMQLQNL